MWNLEQRWSQRGVGLIPRLASHSGSTEVQLGQISRRKIDDVIDYKAGRAGDSFRNYSRSMIVTDFDSFTIMPFRVHCLSGHSKSARCTPTEVSGTAPSSRKNATSWIRSFPLSSQFPWELDISTRLNFGSGSVAFGA